MRSFYADLAMLGIALIWGISFHFIHDALFDIGSFAFITIRFLIASLFLMFINKGRLRWHSSGVMIGFFLFLAFALQTYGLNWTTPGKAAFITGLSVILVPLLTALRSRELPGLPVFLGILLAVIGLGLLTLEGNLMPNLGDILVFFCAFFFALHIIAVAEGLKKLDPLNLTIIQLATVAFLGGGMWGITMEKVNWTIDVFLALFITSIFCSSLAYLIQSWAQQYTTPTRISLVLAAEPVFAAIFSRIMGDEFFTLQKLLGCALVLSGIIASESIGQKKIRKQLRLKTIPSKT